MSRKVIFLDIDGVIAPTFEGEFYSQRKEFDDKQPDYDESVYKEKAAAYAKESGMSEIHPYDYYTIETAWDRSCIQKVKEVMEKTDSVYVLESSWTNAYYTPERMKPVMTLAKMEERYSGIAPGRRKNEGIDEYLAKHDDIERFIIIDDDDSWYFSDNYGMYFVRTHHLINDQDCMVAADLLKNDYKISHDKSHIRIEDVTGKESNAETDGNAENECGSESEKNAERSSSWIIAEYTLVEDNNLKMFMFENVIAEYPNDEKRTVLVRHLIAETSRMAVQEGQEQKIMIILPEHLGEGIILHHKYNIWNGGMLLPDGRLVPERTYVVTYSYSSTSTARRWAELYYESVGKEWTKEIRRLWY